MFLGFLNRMFRKRFSIKILIPSGFPGSPEKLFLFVRLQFFSKKRGGNPKRD